MKPVSVSVLITCFNRRALTLGCLAALLAAGDETIHLSVYLVDDGSTDGTSEAVSGQYPDVRIIQSAGNLYWNRGMRLAWEHAATGPCDYYLWLNDDTELVPGSLRRLVEQAQAHADRAIVVGRIVDPTSGVVIYGGQSYEDRRIKLGFGPSLPYRSLALVTDDREFCDTLNGNCVLISRQIADAVGMNDPVFWHAMGDTDYGLRARAKGFSVTQLLPPVAFGEYNHEYQRKLSVLTPRNWKFIFFHPKGRRPSEQLHYYRAYARPFWLLRVLLSYVKMIRFRAE